VRWGRPLGAAPEPIGFSRKIASGFKGVDATLVSLGCACESWAERASLVAAGDSPMNRRALLVLTPALLSSLMAVAMNLRPHHHTGFVDLGNPLAEAWSPEPRTEYGWPVTAYRSFDTPSIVNAEGRFDTFGFAVDGAISLACIAGAVAVGLAALRREESK
jgi:hypothetical protein